MGDEDIKILIVADSFELQRAFERAFKSGLGVGVETCDYRYAREAFPPAVPGANITHIMFYLHDEKYSIDHGILGLCQLRKKYLRYESLGFIGLGFEDKENISKRYPIFKQKGHLYIQLPLCLKEMKKSIIDVTGHDITMEEIEQLCPGLRGHHS